MTRIIRISPGIYKATGLFFLWYRRVLRESRTKEGTEKPLTGMGRAGEGSPGEKALLAVCQDIDDDTGADEFERLGADMDLSEDIPLTEAVLPRVGEAKTAGGEVDRDE